MYISQWLIYHRKDCFRNCKHQFSLSSLHRFLQRLLQKLFFSRFVLIVIIWYVLLDFSYKIIQIEFFRDFAIASEMFKFFTIITVKCIDLFFDWCLNRDTRRCWCLRSKFERIRLITRWFLIWWFLIVQNIFQNWFWFFVFITINIFNLVIYISQRLIDELTQMSEFVQIDSFINIWC
jgi:hypothetical protein